MDLRLLEAAKALSRALFAEGINHCFIGGFAANLLGSTCQTEDVDLEIDIADIDEMKQRCRRAVSQDPRFSVVNNKLFFYADPESPPVAIEALSAGHLGLPSDLVTITRNGDLPILHPALLVLTKIKRASMYIGSTRPKSQLKLHNDIRDIICIMEYLQTNGMMIDFVGYRAENMTRDRLYSAVRAMIGHWRDTGALDIVELIRRVMTNSDWDAVMGDGQDPI